MFAERNWKPSWAASGHSTHVYEKVPIDPVRLGHLRPRPEGAVLIFSEVLQLERSDEA